VSRADTTVDLAVIETLETLFRAHYGRLVRALTLVSGNREQAADAVQEAFVKAHLHWRRVSRYDDPVGWVRRVAINRLRDEHRRNGRKQQAMERLAARPDEGDLAIDAEPSADATIMTTLADLPRQQRLAVALFYVDGLSVAEVAVAMRLSEGAVKFHLHQGRERLRSVLGGADQRAAFLDRQPVPDAAGPELG
jgi:RNA polymerase sigma-70 factor (ECF subfamily)